MKIAPTSAAMKRSGRKTCCQPASAGPTNTGATPAGSVRGRAAISQICSPPGAADGVATSVAIACLVTGADSRAVGEAREVRSALLQIRLATLGSLIAHVVEEVGVVGQLLNPRQSVLVGVEAGLQQPQAERRHRQ